MPIRIDLIDGNEEETSVWLDRVKPELVDEYGCPAIDMETHPYYPQQYMPYIPGADPVKSVLDAFFMKPSPGLPFYELDDSFKTAITIMTGKLVKAIDKY